MGRVTKTISLAHIVNFVNANKGSDVLLAEARKGRPGSFIDDEVARLTYDINFSLDAYASGQINPLENRTYTIPLHRAHAAMATFRTPGDAVEFLVKTRFDDNDDFVKTVRSVAYGMIGYKSPLGVKLLRNITSAQPLGVNGGVLVRTLVEFIGATSPLPHQFTYSIRDNHLTITYLVDDEVQPPLFDLEDDCE